MDAGKKGDDDASIESDGIRDIEVKSVQPVSK
jgi:hypothetical protein